MDSPTHIHWLDLVGAQYMSPEGHLFRDGWGDREGIEGFGRVVLAEGEPPSIWPSLRPAQAIGPGRAYEGTFRSPAAYLPEESRLVSMRLRLPPGQARVICVIYGAHGEQEWTRRRWLARPLLREGIGSVLLDIPYYGRRIPDGQVGRSVRSVADQMRLGAAVVDESAAVVRWLREQGYRPALVGFSMGGTLASYTAVRVPWATPLVAHATGATGATVTARDLLSRQVYWPALGEDEVEARARMHEVFDAYALRALRPPADPSQAWLIGCRKDGFVAPETVEELHRHWRGSHLEWMDTGHVAGFFLGAERIRRAMLALRDR